MQAIRQWTTGALLGCAIALGGSGCGEPKSGEGDGDSTNAGGANGDVVEGPVSFEEFPAALAGVLCGWIAPCCPRLDLPFDAGECARNFESGVTEMLASADPDNHAYDAALAGDCLATAQEFYGRVGCDRPASVDAAVRVCNGTFGGQLEPGAPCTADIECAATNDASVECAAGVCLATSPATEGEACHCVEASDTVACSGPVQGICYPSDRLYCGDGVCKPRPAWGEPCEQDVCVEGFCMDGVCGNTTDEDWCTMDEDCEIDAYCTRNACAPDKPNGANCERDSECLSYFCSEGECAEPLRLDSEDAPNDISRLCHEASD